jgi:hypothetical protein
MRGIPRVALLGLTIAITACGSGDDSGAGGGEGGLDAATTLDATEDRTAPHDAGTDAGAEPSDDAPSTDAGADAAETGGESDAPSEAWDAGEADAGDADASAADTGNADVDAGNADATAGDADAYADADAGNADADAGDADGITFGDPVCTPHSGTRLKVEWYQDADGARIFHGMYDSMLNVRCSPAYTADGTLRCLPLATEAGGFSVFSDSMCSMPVVSGDSCVPSPYAAFFAGSGPCANVYGAAKYSMYPLGAELSDGGGAAPVFFKNGTSCSPSFTSGSALYSVATVPAPDSTFVDGTAGALTTGRYGVTTVQYSDGAFFCEANHGFFDTTLQVLTAEAVVSDDSTRLVPIAQAPHGFSDGMCTTPATVASSGPTCLGAAPFSPGPFTIEYPVCGGPPTVRAVGAALDGGFVPSVAPDGGPACVPAPPPDGGTWNAVSAPLPPSTFGQTLTQNSGTGRLQYVNHAAPGGLRWRYGELFDTQTGKLCSLSGQAGDTTPCIPFEYQAWSGYSDDHCSKPLYVIQLTSMCNTTPSPGSTAWANDGACGNKVVHVGGPFTGTAYGGNSTSCSPVSFGDSVLYLGVDDIDPTTFVQMTRVLE